MSQPILEFSSTAKPPAGRRRWLAAALAAIALAVVIYFAEAHRSIQTLESAIKSAGGAVMFPPSLSQVMRQRWTGEPIPNPTYVLLQSDRIDGDWLRAQDNLRAFRIEGLRIDQTSLEADDAAELVRAHPLSEFVAADIPETDGVAAALRDVPTLRKLNLSNSDLSDDGFRQLPLEQLHELRVPASRVTCAGLLDLRRCEELRHVALDGRQIDAQIVRLFDALPHIEHITLTGDDVTDDSLQLLHGANLKSVNLLRTSTTREGITLLKSTTPGCRINIGERHVM